MRKIILIFSVLSTLAASAQQQTTFTQYYSNDLLINPAISGSKNYNPLTFQTRQQWLGFKNAPLASNISYQTAINNRSAMGGYLAFEKSSPSFHADLNLNYAYHVPLNYDRVNISFGIGGKLMYYNLDFDLEDLPPGYDPAYTASSFESVSYDASSGAYLYGRNFYFGFSAANILQSSFNTPISGSLTPNAVSRNFYGLGGYRFYMMNNDWQFEPSFLVRKQEYQDMLLSLNARIFYMEDTWAGLTYKTDGNLGFAFGFASNDTHFSYSYDHTLRGDMQQYNFGTHEIGISFRIHAFVTQRHIGFWEY